MKITASVSTRNRYDSTLPVCLMSVAMQNRPPDELIIFDDGEHKDLREDALYKGIFRLFDVKGIEWRVLFGEGKGQVLNHQKTLSEAKHELIWRFDDDHYHEPEVLATLEKWLEVSTDSTSKGVGAVGCLIIDPKTGAFQNEAASSKIEDIYLGMNEQWYIFPKGSADVREVDHLYSSFLFRKEAAVHGYDMNLSRVGHREETIFTYRMKLAGWKLLITQDCVTWHFNNPSGGIRDNTKEEMWKHDEEIFGNYMKQWDVKSTSTVYAVLNNGIGDHYAFKTILPSLLLHSGKKRVVLACTFPEIFKDTGLPLISIGQAQGMFDCSRYDIYKWMIDHNWRGTLIEAFRRMYL
jgi:glycosyltransferase involved in cell wall biosynthesis